MTQNATTIGEGLEGTISEVEARLQNDELVSLLERELGTEGQLEAVVADALDKLQMVLGNAERALEVVNDTVIGSIDEALETYGPPAEQYNMYRYIGMYVLYGLAILLVLVMLGMALVRWPFFHSLALCLFMVLMVVTCAVMVAHAVGVKVADDSCVDLNLEAYVTYNVVEREMTRDVIEFYLSVGEDTRNFDDVYDVIRVAFDIDIRESMAALDRTIETVESTLQYRMELVELAIRNSGLVAQVGGLERAIQEVKDALSEVKSQTISLQKTVGSTVGLLEPDQVMKQYGEMRGYFCCESVDYVGGWWLGLTLTLSFGFAMVLFAFGVSSVLDTLPLRAWYARYVVVVPGHR